MLRLHGRSCPASTTCLCSAPRLLPCELEGAWPLFFSCPLQLRSGFAVCNAPGAAVPDLYPFKEESSSIVLPMLCACASPLQRWSNTASTTPRLPTRRTRAPPASSSSDKPAP